ncbi:hypothetical protein [Streptomyces sp. NPDC093598]|uniref:hypothetical protein n=1 Tax=Streptomyces sp. NPDC093598 TaxID=3366046 RepID=UPI003825D834
MTLAASSWWDDWPKFLPGWLAFLATVGTWAHKAWTRRHKVALGPDDEAVRLALTTARGLFREIIDQRGFEVTWYLAEERRDAGQRLKDLSRRRDDPQLVEAMTLVAQAWADAAAGAPPSRIMMTYGDEPQTPRELRRRRKHDEARERQVDSARVGIERVETALERLNTLERKAFGRS